MLQAAVGLAVAVLTLVAWYRRAGTLALRASLLAVALLLIAFFAIIYRRIAVAERKRDSLQTA